ncbi:MAG TPA: CoA pyrophosphatase [Solirubrobacteraceae bacterium]|nr:CoA pyrophosphatase [Solirubrobacteraceae bacterium]
MNLEQARRLRDVLLVSDDPPTVELGGLVESAVLVPLYIRDDELHIVLIERGSDLRTHAGQISFPGGRRDPTDAELVHTALREAHEEIGLDPAAVELFGSLAPVATAVTDFAIYPFVGLIAHGHEWVLAPLEVEAVIECPVTELAATHEYRTLTRDGLPFPTDCYTTGRHLVWGATARILTDLLDRLAQVDRFDSADGPTAQALRPRLPPPPATPPGPPGRTRRSGGGRG